MNKLWYNKKVSIIYLIIYLLLVGNFFFLALQNGSASSSTSGGFAKYLYGIFNYIFKNRIPFDVFSGFIRKLVGHFLYSSLIGCALFWSLIHSKIRNKALYLGLSIVLVSALEEILQFIPDGRSPEIRDVIINASGEILGILVGFIIFLIINKKHRSEQNVE